MPENEPPRSTIRGVPAERELKELLEVEISSELNRVDPGTAEEYVYVRLMVGSSDDAGARGHRLVADLDPEQARELAAELREQADRAGDRPRFGDG